MSVREPNDALTVTLLTLGFCRLCWFRWLIGLPYGFPWPAPCFLRSYVLPAYRITISCWHIHSLVANRHAGDTINASSGRYFRKGSGPDVNCRPVSPLTMTSQTLLSGL